MPTENSPPEESAAVPLAGGVVPPAGPNRFHSHIMSITTAAKVKTLLSFSHGFLSQSIFITNFVRLRLYCSTDLLNVIIYLIE